MMTIGCNGTIPRDRMFRFAAFLWSSDSLGEYFGIVNPQVERWRQHLEDLRVFRVYHDLEQD